jgi:hypothetical protein
MHAQRAIPDHIRPALSMKLTILLACAMLLASPASRAQSTIANDSFTDGDRSTQTPPSSLAWYVNSTTPSNLSVKNGALDIVVGNNARTVWAYFPAVTLNVGDTLTLSVDFGFTVNADSGFRLALCTTNGTTPLKSDNQAGPTGNYAGYGFFNGGNTNKTLLFKRDGVFAPNATSSLLDSLGSGATSIWSSHVSSAGTGGPSTANTPYTVVFKVTRTAADTAVITSNVSGAGLTANGNLSMLDSSGIVSTFDTLAIDFITNAFAGDMTITRAAMSVSSTPVFTSQPVSRGVTVGTNALFTAAAIANPPPSFQWQRQAAGSNTWTNVSDSSTYSGTTSSALLVSGVTSTMNGDQFRVVATNANSTVTSNAGGLSTVDANTVGRIINLSILTSIAASNDSFSMGYTVGGDGTTGTKPLVIRADGPSLGALGVSGALDDPQMDFYAGSTRTGGNNDWGGGSDLAAAMSSVGAFPFASPASKDAAAFANLPKGGNSVVVSANGNGTGAVIAEIYDATPAASFGAATPRLTNVSVLKPIGNGLTAGFVIGGSTPRPVLIRAIGPSLATFGVSGVLSDPQLMLFDSSQATVGQNDDWGGSTALTAAFGITGAFSLPANSKDAALVTTLSPGLYTVQVSGVGGATGIALVEIYELP